MGVLTVYFQYCATYTSFLNASRCMYSIPDCWRSVTIVLTLKGSNYNIIVKHFHLVAIAWCDLKLTERPFLKPSSSVVVPDNPFQFA